MNLLEIRQGLTMAAEQAMQAHDYVEAAHDVAVHAGATLEEASYGSSNTDVRLAREHLQSMLSGLGEAAMRLQALKTTINKSNDHL